MEEDTVNWKTSHTNHYHVEPSKPYVPASTRIQPVPVVAPVQPSGGLLAKAIGPLILAGGILGTGGLGTAGYVAVKAFEYFGKKPAVVSQPSVQPVVRDSEVRVRFVGGEESQE